MAECACCGGDPTRQDRVTGELLCDRCSKQLFGTGWQEHTQPLQEEDDADSSS